MKSRMAAMGEGRDLGSEGSSKNEKGLMVMDNSEVIAAGRRYKGTKW